MHWQHGALAVLVGIAGNAAFAQHDVGDPYQAPAEQAPGPANPDAQALSPHTPDRQRLPPRDIHEPERAPAPPPGQHPEAPVPPGQARGPDWLEREPQTPLFEEPDYADALQPWTRQHPGRDRMAQPEQESHERRP